MVRMAAERRAVVGGSVDCRLKFKSCMRGCGTPVSCSPKPKPSKPAPRPAPKRPVAKKQENFRSGNCVLRTRPVWGDGKGLTL